MNAKDLTAYLIFWTSQKESLLSAVTDNGPTY